MARQTRDQRSKRALTQVKYQISLVKLSIADTFRISTRSICTGLRTAVPTARCKYSKTTAPFNNIFEDEKLSDLAADLIRASLAESTWRKHTSAHNCLKEFAKQNNITITWPLDHSLTCNFAAWAISSKGLKCSTVNSYLSSLSTIHELKGHEGKNCTNYLTKRVIQGAQNLEFYNDKQVESRKVMSLPLLKILGHEIAISDWSENSKQVIFTAAVVAFFGAFRMGEILHKSKWQYNPFETLTWNDVVVTGVDSLLIHLKMDKSRNPKVLTLICLPLQAMDVALYKR